MNWPCAVSSQTLPKDYLSNLDSTIGLLSLNSQNSLAGTDQFPIADSLTYCFYVRREIFDENPRVNRINSSFPKFFDWKANKFLSFWSERNFVRFRSLILKCRAAEGFFDQNLPGLTGWTRSQHVMKLLIVRVALNPSRFLTLIVAPISRFQLPQQEIFDGMI